LSPGLDGKVFLPGRYNRPALGIGILDQKIAGKAREVNSGVWALGSFAARDHLLRVQEVIWNGFPAFFICTSFDECSEKSVGCHTSEGDRQVHLQDGRRK